MAEVTYTLHNIQKAIVNEVPYIASPARPEADSSDLLCIIGTIRLDSNVHDKDVECLNFLMLCLYGQSDNASQQ